jgi:hypothetical protein
MVEARWQAKRFRAAHEGAGKALGQCSDALVEGLVIAEAGQPGDAQPGRGEFAQRAVQQSGVMREAELTPEDVMAVHACAVWFPEDVIGPVQRLDALVTWPAGVRPDHAAVEQGEEVLHLVPLRVVDRVACGHGQLRGHSAGGAGHGVQGAQRGVDRVHRERLLRALHRHDLGVPGIGEVPVQELEPGR